MLREERPEMHTFGSRFLGSYGRDDCILVSAPQIIHNIVFKDEFLSLEVENGTAINMKLNVRALFST